MKGKIFLLAIFFLTLHVVASCDKTNITVTKYKPKNGNDTELGTNNKTDSQGSGNSNGDLFMGQNIINYFKNILNDLNNHSKKDSDVPDDVKIIGQVSEQVPTTIEGTDDEEGDDGVNAPGQNGAQSGQQTGANNDRLTVAQSGHNVGEAQSNLPVKGEMYSGSSLKFSDELYEDILNSLSKKGGEEGINYDHKYNEFKKEYDGFLSLNKNEYEIIGKLVAAFSVYNDAIGEDADSVYESIKKSFTDPKFKQEFKDFMNGLYDYANTKHHIRGAQTEEAKTYLMLFQNVLNFLNMI
ncbi:hypothetical protein AK88_04059 [Plasmodium fragile]|uniref:Merozoite surface protein C-terminal domain-containing protein n=1 Tax=Plasmodium fragile TaxID=5857 RepID=A0A0D9QGZ5_PLAFR|nr:uncharacterized protein AK88_04059 [Plasmodium fragile]KJP86340.1 hypothetical protein AK88_04059 [Plasmodium fragile]